MENQGANRFVEQLKALCCRRWKPDAAQLELYRSKLSKWFMTEEAWARAISRIAADWQDEGLPSLAYIYTHLKSAETDAPTPGSQSFVLFTLKGVRYARRISDPSSPPGCPVGADDIHLAVAPECQALEREPEEVPF